MVIIVTYASFTEAELVSFKPAKVYVDSKNKIKDAPRLQAVG
jgi:aspartate 1-decarboxylase